MNTKIKKYRRKELLRGLKQQKVICDIAISPMIVSGEIEELSCYITEIASKTIEVERVSIWFFNHDETILRCVDLYEATPDSHSSGYVLLENEFQDEFSDLKSSQYIDASAPFTDPRTAGYVNNYLKPLNITSMLDTVIRSFGKNRGVICFEHVNKKHHWRQDEITFACQLADQIALAMSNREKKKAEEELRKSEERFRNVIDASEAYVFESHMNGVITFISERVRDILGYEPQEVIGKTPFDFMVSPDEASRVGAIFGEILKDNRSFRHIEHICLTKDKQERILSATALPVFDSAGEIKGFQGTVEDITERKRAEEEQEKLRSQLRQSQKMEAIGTLAGGIAHDFNNILAVILGYTELSLALVQEDNLLKSNLNKIIKSGKRAKEVVRQILTFSRKGEQDLKPLIINLIIEEAIQLLRVSLPSTIEIIYTGCNKSIILGDVTQLHQIIMNLGTNAFYAMKEYGGILKINLENILLEKEDVNLYIGLKPGPFVRLTVSDTGNGIPAEYIDKIFEPYFTTKELWEGTGLGLSVVLGIVKSYGGDIKVYSEYGKGTKFEMVFPVINTEVNITEKAGPPIQGGTESILIVDDDVNIVEIIQKFLEVLGYKVTSKYNSIDALDTFKKDPGIFDMVITDLTMPRMTGLELIIELHKIKPDLPVILCTGNENNMKVNELKEAHIADYMLKPFSKNALACKIRCLLDKS